MSGTSFWAQVSRQVVEMVEEIRNGRKCFQALISFVPCGTVDLEVKHGVLATSI